MASSKIKPIYNPNIVRQSVSVLTYAASLPEGIYFYSTNGNASDNPISGVSFGYIIFKGAASATIFGMELGANALFVNSGSPQNWAGWKQIQIAT